MTSVHRPMHMALIVAYLFGVLVGGLSTGVLVWWLA